MSTRASGATVESRVAELIGYFADPLAGRLSDEQRATMLGIARRLIQSVVRALDLDIDGSALWDDWSRRGLPAAALIAPFCHCRAEEHRWRSGDAVPGREAPATEAGAEPTEIDAILPDTTDTGGAALDAAFLAVQLADGRRFDRFDNPCLTPSDLGIEAYRALVVDIAAELLAARGNDRGWATLLGERVRAVVADAEADDGIDAAAQTYFAQVARLGVVKEVAGAAIERAEWGTFLALTAAAHGRPYRWAARAMLSADRETLAALSTPFALDSLSEARLWSALDKLPHRAIAPGQAEAIAAALRSHVAAQTLLSKGEGEA